MIKSQEIQSELANVLEDPHLARSPVLSRLLSYLVEHTLAGTGKELNSYALAVDGLGRTADFDPQTDSYARVQVARLRKLLEAHYVGPGRHRPQRIAIEPRSYETRLVENEASRQVPAEDGFPVGSGRHSGRHWHPAQLAWLAGVAALLLGIAALAYVTYAKQAAKDLAHWQTSDFPALTIAAEGYDRSNADAVDTMLEGRFISTLAKYEGVRVNFARNTANEFRLNVRTRRLNNATNVDLLLVEDKTGRLIWSDSGQIGDKELETPTPGRGFLSRAAFHIAHPTGAIHAYKRRRIVSPNSPYGCWLRFMGQLQTQQSTVDSALASCAQKWHAAAPDHPLAAALWGWSLLDQSIGKLTEADRKATVARARDMLEEVGLLNPDSAFLQLTMMRAYAFMGDDSAVKLKGAKTLALNPENPDVQGMVGTLLAMRGDPQGEVLLKDAIAHHGNPPPRYFIGIFLAAMMREDVGPAGAALENIRQFRHNLPIVAVLEAAYFARTGNKAAAHRSWSKAESMLPALRINPRLMFERLPLAPQVRSRLIQWAAPAYT